MKFINKVIMRGIVGNASVNQVGDKDSIAFSLVTNHCYRDKQGNAIVDTLWVNVTAFVETGSELSEKIKKGATIEVEGRLRLVKHVDAYGTEVRTPQIVAKTLKVIEKDEL